MINMGGSIAAERCTQHHWVARLRGGEPLSVSICSLCDEINWPLLREDLDRILIDQRAGRNIDGLCSQCQQPWDELHQKRREAIDDVVNATERPEDKVRRYAKQLWDLQEGLRQRGVDMSRVCEDHIVQHALECLDEATEAAKSYTEGTSLSPNVHTMTLRWKTDTGGVRPL